MNKKINILEKIEYVHATLQEQRGQTAYTDMIDNSILIIEELREKYINNAQIKDREDRQRGEPDNLSSLLF